MITLILVDALKRVKTFPNRSKDLFGHFITSYILTGHFQPLKMSNIVFQSIASIEHSLKWKYRIAASGIPHSHTYRIDCQNRAYPPQLRIQKRDPQHWLN
jgi:hypothetical protein